MKHFDIPNINTPEYWDTHQTALDFGLRQETYSQLITGESVCELGCGLSPFLSRQTGLRVGVDFSPTTVQEARRLYPGVTYVCDDVTKVPFHDQTFDSVVAGEVIEHLKDPKRLIIEMHRLTKPGGMMVLSTPNLEFKDPEHLWEFDEEWFQNLGFFTMKVESTRFPGRSYIFAWKQR